MIDKLISSDFAVLAREHWRVPPLDAVMPTPVEATPRMPFAWGPWLLRGAAIGVAALVYVSNDMFERWPQALPIIALAIISLVGLIAAPARSSFHRELGAIFGAAAIVVSSTVMLYLSWTASPVLDIDRDGAAIRSPYPSPYPPQLWSVALASAIAVGLGYGLARCVRPRPRTLQPWSGLATVMTATMFLTLIVAQEFQPRWFDEIPFDARMGTTLAQVPLWHTVAKFTDAARHSVLDNIAEWQVYVLTAAGVVTSVVATVAIAYRSRSRLATRWLALVSHVTVVPLFVAVAMWQMIGVFMHDFYGGQDDRALAMATAAVLIALTSMMVRRERRGSALH